MMLVKSKRESILSYLVSKVKLDTLIFLGIECICFSWHISVISYVRLNYDVSIHMHFNVI